MSLAHCQSCAAENRLIRSRELGWPLKTYTWKELEMTFQKMKWVLGQNEEAARMIWLLLGRFHSGYVKWDDVQEVIDMMFFVLLSWLLQKAVGKLTISRGSSLARLSKNALMHGLIPIVQYEEVTYATRTFVVDKPPWPMYVERAVRVMNDLVFATRFGRTSTMSRGQCETLQSAHSGRLRLIQDFRPMNDVNLSHGYVPIERDMMHSMVDDAMPSLVSSTTSSTSSTCEVYEEF